jgi:hypothetical protein
MSQDAKRTTTRRAVLAGAPAVAAAMAGGTALAAVTPDPIFAAIDRYKAAVEAWVVLIDTGTDTTEAFAAQWEARGDLLHTLPTTIAGSAALLEVLGSDPYCDGSYSTASIAYNNHDVKCSITATCSRSSYREQPRSSASHRTSSRLRTSARSS